MTGNTCWTPLSASFSDRPESYVVGSHEFYLGYAVKNGIMPCLDAGHFHPTETISDKISAILLFCDELLLHVSRESGGTATTWLS